jgi:uncharacterized protein YegL
MKEQKLKKNVLLDYTFVLDASGSMSGEIAEVLDEVNRQIRELKSKYEESERPCRVTIVKFDTVYTVLRDSERIQNLQEITLEEYFAGGMTALYDAIGLAVKRADARVNFKVRRGDAEVLVVVFTDGGENASSEFTGHDIQALLKDYQEREGWDIALIGTDISAIHDMERRSMKRDMMRKYKSNEKRRALYNLSSSVSDYYSVSDSKFSLNKEKWMAEQERRNRENDRG